MTLRHRMIHRKVERIARDDGKPAIAGYAAVFYRDDDPGTQYEFWPDVFERISPHAFDRALKDRHNVAGLFNHDPDNLLGRTKAGTLTLRVDAIGLRYQIDLPDTQLARDVLALIDRGDISGSSFAFIPTKITEQRGETQVQTIEDLDLFDVGPVVFPAYEATTTGRRSLRLQPNDQPPPEVAAFYAEREAKRKQRQRMFCKVAAMQAVENMKPNRF